MSSPTSVNSALCEAALDLAQAGYSVFPCRERGKAPLTSRGFKDATRDERRILQWWDRWPTANIGVACEASGIAVVDIDVKAGAIPGDILHELNGPGRPLIVSWTGLAANGRRGAHAWYRGLARTGATRWTGVEIRSRGAYIITPPSLHPTGVPYKWRTTGPVPVRQLPELPADLHDGGARRGGAAEDWGAPPAADIPLPAGKRNNGLVLIAGSLLARRVFEPDLLTGALLEANHRRCRPPLPESEVRKVAAWAASSEEALRVRVEDEVARRLFAAWREDATA